MTYKILYAIQIFYLRFVSVTVSESNNNVDVIVEQSDLITANSTLQFVGSDSFPSMLYVQSNGAFQFQPVSTAALVDISDQCSDDLLHQCVLDIDWARTDGWTNQPHVYPNFSDYTGVIGDPSRYGTFADWQRYFMCTDIISCNTIIVNEGGYSINGL